jgi:hypothetical protein
MRVEIPMLKRRAMTKAPRFVFAAGVGLLAVCVAPVLHAQAAPSAAHPRVWLDQATRLGLQAQASDSASAVARGAARCAAARANPSSYAVGGWQGFEFVTTLSGCLTSWVASNDAADLATAIKYWNVLLDDYAEVGDGLGGDTVVTHDTGYAMRTFAPFAALAYDWLHDAPGVTEPLRAHARARFGAWLTYYSSTGYLRDLAGANYQAGYTFAATLMAIAEGGEAGAAGDAHWATVRDTIWTKTLVPALAPSGILQGGDWAEGWQYGPLSVLEYSLAARAMRDNGMAIPGAASWASSLALRFAHGLTPVAKQTFIGGDSDTATPNRNPDNGALLAVIAGPASDQAKSWARKFNADLGLKNENALFDALAAAASGPSAALPEGAPTNHLAQGVGNWYARGAWAADTAWSVFQCSRHLVADHEYSNAGNWVLTRGADDLVVDPSPYGSLSTLTGNAPAIDSGVLPAGYSPSQGYWGEATALRWARQSGSGVAAGRCDYADQFRRSDVPSDVSHALRDFVLVPHEGGGTVVLVDRAVTGAAERALHLRVRTPSSLVLAGDGATSTVGASSLAISKVWASSGTPNVREMPRASECPSSSHTCDVSRLAAGTEYRIDVSGPSAFAIHVVNAQASGTSAKPAVLLSGSGYRGALVAQGSASVAVITNDAPDGVLGSSLSYRVPAAAGTVHVVVDAPVDGAGKSDVTSVQDGSECKVVVTPHVAGAGGLDGRPLILLTAAGCTVADDGVRAAVDPGAGGMAEGSGAAGADAGGADAGSTSTGSAGAAGTSNAHGGAGSVASAGSSGSTPSALGSADGPSSSGAPGCAVRAPARGVPEPVALLAGGALGLWLFGRRRSRRSET